MTILPANESHIPGMIALLRQVGEVHRRIRPDIFRNGAQKYDEAALKALLMDKDSPIFVAVEEDFVQGYCFCVRKAFGGGACTDRVELYIDDLCVDENCRGQGVATALYAHVVDYAREIGCSFVTLNVWQGNDTAQRFYEHLGMRRRSMTMEMPLEEAQC